MLQLIERRILQRLQEDAGGATPGFSKGIRYNRRELLNV